MACSCAFRESRVWFHPVNDITNKNFGVLIAFLLPGFVTVLGLGCVSDVVATWVHAGGSNAPSVGGFLYLTLASLLAGLTVSTIRWAVIDTIHHWSGIPRPSWDFNRLKHNVDLYHLLNENHYRFYQFYSNMIVALCVVLVARRWPQCATTTAVGSIDVGCVLLILVFTLGSRDTFRKFHLRVDHFLRREPDDGDDAQIPATGPSEENGEVDH